MRRGLLIALALSVLFMVVVGYILLTNVVMPIASALSGTPEPLPKYATVTVLEVCNLFALDVDDPFCIEPTDQTARTLENLLYRKFPPGIWTFDAMMPLLDGLPSVTRQMSLKKRDFAPEGCRMLALSKPDDECMVISPGEISIVTIRFDEQGRVTFYGVTGANGGGS